MKKNLAFVFLAVILIVGLSGCATSKQLASNLKGKSLAGNGFISIQKIVLTEPETGTYTPEISSMVINGDFQSVLKDANFLRYDRKESASVFNASCKTVSESLTINLNAPGSMPDIVSKVAEYRKVQAETTETTASGNENATSDNETAGSDNKTESATTETTSAADTSTTETNTASSADTSSTTSGATQ